MTINNLKKANLCKARLFFAYSWLLIFLLIYTKIVFADNLPTSRAKQLTTRIPVPIVAQVTSAQLTVEQYIQQAEGGNDSFVASQKSIQGTKLRSSESAHILWPTLYGSYSAYSDASDKSAPSVMGAKTIQESYLLGIKQLTNFGLSGAVSYSLARTKIDGTTPGAVPLTDYYDTAPKVDLSFSLLKNGFGREVRAGIEAQGAQVNAAKYGEEFRHTLLRSDAEMAYWRLSLARDAYEVDSQSLDRAQKIRDWNASRVKVRLADESDLLQAEAIVRLRKLETQSALDELRAASLNFNTVRGVEGEQVKETLISLDKIEMNQIAPKVKDASRNDVKQAKELLKAARASAQLAVEKYTPELELFATYNLNARRLDPAVSQSSVWGEQKPTSLVGMRFSMPLDVGITSDLRQGYQAELQASELRVRRKEFEAQRDFLDIQKKFTESLARYELAKAIEKTQQEKYSREKFRHANGRTTTYFVLLFEQDFASAQLNRLRSQMDVIQLATQLKTYGEIQ